MTGWIEPQALEAERKLVEVERSLRGLSFVHPAPEPPEFFFGLMSVSHLRNLIHDA